MRVTRWLLDPAIRLAVLVVTVLWGVISHSTYAGSGDEPHYLAIAHSLAFDRDLNLANNYGANEPLIGDGGSDPGRHVLRGRDGVVRPVHDVGLPAMFVPWVLVMRPSAAALAATLPASALRKARLTPSTLYRHLISTGMILITAWLAVLLFRLAVRTGTAPQAAFFGSALVLLSPPFLIFGALLFTEVLSPLTNAHGWTGGWSPPARFLVPVLPVVALLVIRGLSVAPRAICAPLLAVQLSSRAEQQIYRKSAEADGRNFLILKVVNREGVEPSTNRLRVCCSAN